MPGMRGDQTLFEHLRKQREGETAPLAARMRPRTLEEFAGQEHLLGPGHILERAIRADQVLTVCTTASKPRRGAHGPTWLKDDNEM